jgi:hypothetical protein
MRKFIYAGSAAALITLAILSCKKSATSSENSLLLADDEKALVASAGFNSNWAERSPDGGFLIEGDILLTKAQLKGMAGATPTNNIIVADEEHYRTYNVVSTPGTGARNISVSLGSGFPANYSTALDNAIAQYNSYGLKITFSRVASGGNIVITSANLGTSGGGCILGRAAGFPDANGNPSPGLH